MITGHTELFTLLAHPVAHVRTPQKFNAYLAEREIDAVVVVLDVAANGLRAVVSGLRAIANLRGLIVTIPHKIEIVGLCDALHDSARGVGAVNAIRREPDGRLVGANFDGVGFVRALEAAAGSIAGRAVYLAGAGGVARAIAFACAAAGVRRLTLHNRSQAKARELAGVVAATHPGIEVECGSRAPRACDVAINGTALGLHPGDPLPFDLAGLPPHAVVAEVVMQPLVTPLLEEARRRGFAIVTGDGMLDRQLPLWLEFFGLAPGAAARAA